MTGAPPGQAALRQAVITEVREAASCGSGDGDQCPKCSRHADAILAAVDARPAPGDANRLAIAMAALREIWQDGDDYSARATAETALSDIADLSPRLHPELKPAPECNDECCNPDLPPEPEPAPGPAAAVDTLASAAESRERVMYAALIDIRRGNPGAAKLLLGLQLDGWEGTPWNGADTGAEYLERARDRRSS